MKLATIALILPFLTAVASAGPATAPSIDAKSDAALKQMSTARRYQSVRLRGPCGHGAAG